MNSTISVTASGNYYSLNRQQARLSLENGYKYEYGVHHSISKEFSVRSAKCMPEMDWMQDDCKLKNLTQKLMDHLNCTTPWLLHFAGLDSKS